MKTFKSVDDLPATLTADDVSNYLGISRSGVYNLLRSNDFPTLKIGKRVLVTKEAFIEWVKENTEIKIGKSYE